MPGFGGGAQFVGVGGSRGLKRLCCGSENLVPKRSGEGGVSWPKRSLDSLRLVKNGPVSASLLLPNRDAVLS